MKWGNLDEERIHVMMSIHAYMWFIVIDGEDCKAIQTKKQNCKIFTQDSQIINTWFLFYYTIFYTIVQILNNGWTVLRDE